MMHLPKNQRPGKQITIRANGTKDVGTVFEGETKTQQQFKDEVNVNNIIAKFKKTGSITHVRNRKEGVYADLTNIPDYQEAMGTIAQANHAFSQMPSHIRNRFGHDPSQLIQFLDDPKNNEEAIKLGLKERAPEKQPDPILNELKTLNTNLAQKSAPKKTSKTDESK